METPQLLLVVLLFQWTCISCLKLPAYIKPCSRNDPHLNTCAKQHAIAAIPQLVKGDPKYRIPPLDPLVVEELSVTQGSANFGLSFTARNVTLRGLKNSQVKDIRLDLKTLHFEYDLFVQRVDVLCRYNVSGQVLLIPITGSGDGVIVFKDVDFTIGLDSEKVPGKAGGKEKILPKNISFKMDCQGMSIHLENLFNGNKLLGDNMNIFLNENWRELLQDLTPPVAEAVSQVVKQTLGSIFELVPYDESFPERV